jgi:hypothetical protein
MIDVAIADRCCGLAADPLMHVQQYAKPFWQAKSFEKPN